MLCQPLRDSMWATICSSISMTAAAYMLAGGVVVDHSYWVKVLFMWQASGEMTAPGVTA